MGIASPAFGLLSGFGTSLGLVPHVLTICFFLAIGVPQHSVTFLIVFTIAAKLFGERLFWNNFKSRMDLEVKFKNWRTAVDQSLLSHPNVLIALLMMLADALVDATLINTALKTSLPIAWIFLALLGCQLLSSPIQGLLSDYFSQKKSMLFALLIGMLAVVFSLELPLHGKIPDPSQFSLLNLTGLSSFTVNVQMTIILCVKGLLGNLLVIARGAIAEVIKVETIENFSEI
jgi:hypothetical protein